MPIIDTSLLVDRISEGREITEDVCIISVIEFPMLLEYARFRGRILYPDLQDLELALELQKKLKGIGRMKGSSDLVIAATCINYGEELLTLDHDFEEISKVSGLKVVYG